MTATTTSFHYSGDEQKARELYGLATLQLHKLRNLMSFNNLQQYVIELRDSSGAYIRAASTFGTEIVEVYYPKNPIIPVEPVKKPELEWMVWYTEPPYKKKKDGSMPKDKDGKLTYELDEDKLEENPEVEGGTFFVVSVLNGKDYDKSILQAMFDVQPDMNDKGTETEADDELYKGWACENGAAEVVGETPEVKGTLEYTIDWKSGTVLMGANVEGKATVSAKDKYSILSRRVKIPNGKFFVKTTPNTEVTTTLYKLEEIGEGDVRSVEFDHFVDAGTIQTPRFIRNRSSEETIYDIEVPGDPVPPRHDPPPDTIPTMHFYSQTKTTSWLEYTEDTAPVRPGFDSVWIPVSDLPQLELIHTSHTWCDASGYYWWNGLMQQEDSYIGEWYELTITDNEYPRVAHKQVRADICNKTFSQDDNGWTTVKDRTFTEMYAIIPEVVIDKIKYTNHLFRCDEDGRMTGQVNKSDFNYMYIFSWEGQTAVYVAYVDEDNYCVKFIVGRPDSYQHDYEEPWYHVTGAVFSGIEDEAVFDYPEIPKEVADFSMLNETTIYFGREIKEEE